MRESSTAVIVPVESQVRELDAKLLLACVAAERGFTVIIGSRAYIHYRAPYLPRGVYLAKSMRRLSERMFRILDGLGHSIAAWDEEGLVRFPDEEYYRLRLSEQAFAHASLLFAWGEDDAEVFRRYSGYRGAPIHVTGNPRIDLMRPELRGCFDADVKSISDRFGRFVLINTNFGFVNAFVPSLNLIQETRDGESSIGRNATGMRPEFARGLEAHQRALFNHFRGLVAELSDRFPDQPIVVRPHPAERHDPWLEIAADRPNVHVVTEGNVVPWLLAARALIHNGCTTAVEAAVLDVPAIAYQPVRSVEFDVPLPNDLSHKADTVGAVEGLVRAILDRQIGTVNEDLRKRLFDRHLAALEGPLAAERVVESLEQSGYLEQPPARPGLGRLAQSWLECNYRTAQKLLRRWRRDSRNSAAFHAHRFPGTDKDALESRIRQFGAQLGRFEDLRVAPISRHVFRIERTG